MAINIRSAALRYAIALGSFLLILLISIALPRYTGINLDLTSLMILTMIASAWYLGRGPGLLVAIILEITLNFFSTAPFTVKSLIIIFNRMILFGSLVIFASSRRKAEKRLREQRELLQVTLSSIGDAVIATDINGKINFINPTAEALTGWTMADAANKSLEQIFQIVNEETGEPVESPFVAIKREGTVVGLANHTVLISREGRRIPIEDSGAPIKDADGRTVGVIIVFHDVTERRRAERERETLLRSEQTARGEAEVANRLKDEFLATVSHELRTPLNAILGWATMLKRGNLEAETARNALEIIERNAKAQVEITEDILDVSRIITGKMYIEQRPVEVASVIRTAVETLRPAAEAKLITVNVFVDRGADLIIGDADRLQQVIWNLLSNAIKFTPKNGQIEIRTERSDSYLEIHISDTGIGIDESFLPFIFERFRQADPSIARAHGGLGLGLAIVKHLVELHGGSVRAESAGEDKGTVFIVKLPLAVAPVASANYKPDQSLRETSDIPAQAPDLKNLRVLLVDDEADTIDFLTIALEGFGAEVRSALSSAEALKILPGWTPDIIVSDLGMPGEDGFTFIRKVRNLTPESGGNVPAIALTAYVRNEDRLKSLEAGFQMHISKPVDPDVLAKAVEDLKNTVKT